MFRLPIRIDSIKVVESLRTEKAVQMLTRVLCGILAIVEGKLLAASDVPLGKEADARQVRV